MPSLRHGTVMIDVTDNTLGVLGELICWGAGEAWQQYDLHIPGDGCRLVSRRLLRQPMPGEVRRYERHRRQRGTKL